MADADLPGKPPRFTREEFERRAERARELMTAARLDALLVTGEANFRYLTGFDTLFMLSPTRPWYLVLPRTGEPVAVVPEVGLVGMRETSWVTNIRSWPAPRPDDDGVSLVVDALETASGQFARVGAEMGPETRLGMPVGDFLKVRDALRPAEVVDGSGLLRELRMIKSPGEVDRVRRIAQIASDAFAALPEMAAPGDSEREVCQRLQADLLGRGADKTPYVAAASGPGGYDTIIQSPTDRTLAPGDVMIIDTGSTIDGYWCDFDRHVAVRPVADAVRQAYMTVYRATDAGLATLRPGARAFDVWRAMADVMGEAAVKGNRVGRMGHGLGLNLTEPPSIHPDDETEIVPGMVLTVEPGMAFSPPGGEGARPRLMVHEENVVVTESGCELLTRRAPPEIPAVG